MARTPEDTVRAVTAGVSRLVAGRLPPDEHAAQVDALADLYADPTDVRHPCAPPGSAHARPLRTRAALREHFAAAGAGERFVRFEPVGTVVHTTGDPEVVVVEFAYEGSTGEREVRVPCVFVVRVRDGRIVESRDYAAHHAMA